MVKVQEWLDENYPKEQRSEITKLNIKEKKLEGDLDLMDFVNLKELHGWDNKLTTLNLSNCSQLEKINCSGNLLTNITLPTNPTNLKRIALKNNNFPPQDLSFLAHATNLEELYLGNNYRAKEKIDQGIYNRFTGSLDYLSGMEKLQYLGINNTDINEVDLDKLPKSLKKIWYLTKARPDCKLTEIVTQLRGYEWRDIHSDFTLEERRGWEKARFNKEQTREWIQKGYKINDYENASKEHNKLQQLQLETVTTQSKLITEKVISTIEEITEESDKIFSSAEKPVLESKIGEGGYGEVYQGKWEAREVAVKKLLLNDDTKKREVRDEINILKKLKDRNIIQYYGVYYDNQEIWLIMEYAENGSLTKFINNIKTHDWNLNNNIIKQIVSGLTYIHHKNIIHRDLKSLNVLMTAGNQAKISDFGLSIKDISSSRSKNAVGSLRWMAPEILRNINEPKFSKQSDIYSLGMVIWEIAAKCTEPFKDFGDMAFCVKMSRKETETIPANTPQNIQDVIAGCWKNNPEERMALENIKGKLEVSDVNLEIFDNNSQYQAQIQIPPK